VIGCVLVLFPCQRVVCHKGTLVAALCLILCRVSVEGETVSTEDGGRQINVRKE